MGRLPDLRLFSIEITQLPKYRMYPKYPVQYPGTQLPGPGLSGAGPAQCKKYVKNKTINDAGHESQMAIVVCMGEYAVYRSSRFQQTLAR